MYRDERDVQIHVLQRKRVSCVMHIFLPFRQADVKYVVVSMQRCATYCSISDAHEHYMLFMAPSHDSTIIQQLNGTLDYYGKRAHLLTLIIQ